LLKIFSGSRFHFRKIDFAKLEKEVKFGMVIKRFKNDRMPVPILAYSQAQDADLLHSMKLSDSKAFEELYNRYFPTLVDSAYKKLHSRQKGEDIVQNIFADLYRRRMRIEVTLSFKAYLNQALKFRVLNEYRAGITRTRYQKSLFFNERCKIDFSDSLETKELETTIHLSLSRLPEKCKKVFLLSRNERLSNNDIASNLGISVSTVEKHISKALKTLRHDLKPAITA
jgi:RNA polymerase sigma-70 factor (family 1)